MKFSTKAIHIGQNADIATGATIPPIYQTATFTQESIGKTKGYDYSRSDNPTRESFEKAVAAIENGKFGLAFSSGLAAETAILSILKPGDNIIASNDIYGGTYRLFTSILEQNGITTTFVDSKNPTNIEKMITKNTKLIWIETPTNPLLSIADIKQISNITKNKNILLVVDNTFATPYFQNPLELGADIVVHSITKYINGHSDVIGGAVIINDENLFAKIKFYQNAAGNILGAFDSWLALRGLKTLSIRMEQHEKNAKSIAELLEIQPLIKRVYYPGLNSHHQHELAKQQMKGFGGMISFELTGGINEVQTFISNLKIFSLAESLGGVESLISHPAQMTHASIPKKERELIGITDNLIRISVGIEDIEDLKDDIKTALNSINYVKI